MLLTVKDYPIEIDTAVEDERRWAQVWFGNTCIGHFHDLEDAFAFIEDIIESGPPAMARHWRAGPPGSAHSGQPYRAS